ncbi:hypothetical protein [Lysobacter niastensis]|uniref:Uncharacterized protein n=1 Tax=Lysobacter niastensis TaxID=380629 RepID=A0ABS0B8Q7_9GAMM|nr:hypothetical protein [Lysobacter niastensis]MBF6024618.1 hypothetical protein [Lysobacter niastensis]
MSHRIVLLHAVAAVSLALAACKQGDEATPPSPAKPADAPAPAATTAKAPPPDAARMASGFRAIGNEPGWTAQVAPGDAPALHAEVDYGERKFDIAPATRLPDGWSGKAADGTSLMLKVELKTCRDVMSGQAFEAVATLTVAERTYDGCGNFGPN